MLFVVVSLMLAKPGLLAQTTQCLALSPKIPGSRKFERKFKQRVKRRRTMGDKDDESMPMESIYISDEEQDMAFTSNPDLEDCPTLNDKRNGVASLMEASRKLSLDLSEALKEQMISEALCRRHRVLTERYKAEADRYTAEAEKIKAEVERLNAATRAFAVTTEAVDVACDGHA